MYLLLGKIIGFIVVIALLYILNRKEVKKEIKKWENTWLGSLLYFAHEVKGDLNNEKLEFEGLERTMLKASYYFAIILYWAMWGLFLVGIFYLTMFLYPLVLLIIVVVVLFFLIKITINIIESRKRELLYKEKRQREKEDKEFWGKDY